jgi:hypothetical protein
MGPGSRPTGLAGETIKRYAAWPGRQNGTRLGSPSFMVGETMVDDREKIKPETLKQVQGKTNGNHDMEDGVPNCSLSPLSRLHCFNLRSK